MAQDLFVEVFPLIVSNLPDLYAYVPDFDSSRGDYSADLAQRLTRTFAGEWIFSGKRILTNEDVSPVQLDITLDVLRNEVPDKYGHLNRMFVDGNWRQSAQEVADYINLTRIAAIERELLDVLKSFGTRVKNGYIMREHQLRTWAIADMPAISLSLESHLLYNQNLAQHLQKEPKADVVGLRVMDRSNSSIVGTVTKLIGTVKKHRDNVLLQIERETIQKLLQQAGDDEHIVEVKIGSETQIYPSRGLRILLRETNSDDYERFGIERAQVSKALKLPPDERAKLVRKVSSVLKQKGIIGNAFNSRKFGDHFATLDDMPTVQYANIRTNTYDPARVVQDFVKHGLFARHPRFKEQPIRLGVINTLDKIASDFLEAMRRQIEKDFGFEINLIKERNVRVVNEKNIASAVRVVEAENPHMIVAFFPDAASDFDPHYDYLKSLTLGKGIASHALYESTMNSPDEMSRVMMAILAKTGNVPYALAEPLEHFQRVVGLDFVREHLSRGDRITAMTRIYKNEALFMRYYMESIELETDEPVPASLIEKLFPPMFFKGKEVILHHDGEIPGDVLDILQEVGAKLQANFYPVEIIRRSVPRVYALNKKIVTQPSWGTLFHINDFEAFVVSSVASDDRTPEPLYVNVPLKNVPVDLAVYSVLAWTLLHYGSPGMPRLPVTIQHADDLAEWLSRGMLPDKTEGDVPFWL